MLEGTVLDSISRLAAERASECARLCGFVFAFACVFMFTCLHVGTGGVARSGAEWGGVGGWGGSTGPEVIMAWEPYLFFFFFFAVPDKRFIFQKHLTGSHLYTHHQPTHPFLNFLY